MFYKANDSEYKTLQDGKIKLKTLTYCDDLQLVEFTIEKGVVLPEHSHPNTQIGYLVKGKIEFVIDGKTYIAEPGDSWCIPKNVPHSAKILEDTKVVEVFSPVRKEML